MLINIQTQGAVHPSSDQSVERRVLIIDDEATLRRVTQLTLKIMAGWTVLTAASGIEGLHLAETEQPDAILLDLMMPDLDGMATLTRLHDNSKTSHIPVILLTAKAVTDHAYKLQKLGVAAILVKPFEPQSLVHQIKKILGW